MTKKKAGQIIEEITNPKEIKSVTSASKAQEKEWAAQGAQESETLSAIAKNVNDGHEKLDFKATFKIVWQQIVEFYQERGTFLRGTIMESRNVKGTHYNLSIAADHESLWYLDPQNENLLTTSDEFNLHFDQHRATIFQVGTFDTRQDAQNHMRLLDQYFMHVLAEKGAKNAFLDVSAGDIQLTHDIEGAMDQSYSDALRTACLVQAFRDVAIDSAAPGFHATVGILMRALAADLCLKASQTDEEELSRRKVTFTFDNDIGTFSFVDRGSDDPVQMRHTTGKSSKRSKVMFDGDLTRETLQEALINWFAAAALERQTITQKDFDNLHGHIQAVRGVPLRTSKLGFMSPFPVEGSGYFIHTGLN